MKGVILAGGTGSRLWPCTKVTNKHLLPVYGKPMIYYPIETLKRSGIREVLIVAGAEHAGDFMQLLGSGASFDMHFTYRVQEGAGGIAHALSLAEHFTNGEPLAVILGDNIFEEDFYEDVLYFKQGAKIFVKEVEDPFRFGVVEMLPDGTVLSIEEKPTVPKSSYVQTGFYLYDAQVFDIIRTLKPSARGELEIADVNKAYLAKKQLKTRKLSGFWTDAGTHESLLEANLFAYELQTQKSITTALTKKASLSSLSGKVNPPKVTIGLVTYNAEDYLEPCLESLLQQDYKDVEILIFDNASKDRTREILSKKFPEISVEYSEKNIGFAAAHNRLIAKSKGDYYACFNVDMIFEPFFLSSLVEAIEKDPQYGSAIGKIKCWDVKTWKSQKGAQKEKGKTNFIDSVGIRIYKNHRFEDIGQGEVDMGQYDQVREVFGGSGCAILYRREALEEVAFKRENGTKEYFDELMFAYKEDIDLAYRLQWAGWKCIYTPKAVAYHDRTIAQKGKGWWNILWNRQRKPAAINRLSYLNHQILLQKNFSEAFPWSIRISTWWYNTKVFLFLLFFETETLFQWWKLWKHRHLIALKRKQLLRKVPPEAIVRWMEPRNSY